METIFLKSIFEDGIVYFKIQSLENPTNDYIYEGLELIFEEEDQTWEIDEYELTSEDLAEMYEDDFCDIEEAEFTEAYKKAEDFLS
jgi:hypothetical protein